MQTKPNKPSSIKPTASESGVVSGGSNPSGVIYVDQDSDITSIVSKLRQESSKDVKIVVPKNSAALKSGVNLKLLARTAHSKLKNLSLITSDPKLISMAGAAKIPTAPNLSSDASLASSSVAAAATSIKVNNPDEDLPDLNDSVADAQSSKNLDEDLTIDGSEIEDTSLDNDLEPEESSKKAKSTKDTNGKKVPNFYDFRKKALIGIGAFLGVVIIILLLMTSRKSAVLNIKANAERLDLNFSAKLNESATETSKDELKVVKKSGSKSTTETTPATGEQDIGAKASGNMTLSIACSSVSGSPPTFSKGTRVTSGGLTFLTQSSTSLTAPSFNGGCKFSGNTTVVAENPGSQYNLGARSYTVTGSSSVTGQGGEMSGGTTQVIKIVSQADVATLKEKLTNNNQEAYKTELRSQFSSNQEVLEETFSMQLGDVQITPAVGQQADTVTGTVVASYSIYAADKKELEKILELNINDAKKDPSQSIVKNGADELKISTASNGEYTFSTTAYVGPNIDLDKIKTDVAGKKKGEAIAIVKQTEGVDSASVKLTPFWATTLPRSDKIEIKVEIAGQ